MKQNRKVLILIILLFVNMGLFSQEVLIDLQVNPVIKRNLANKILKDSKSEYTDTLELPFFDDFAKPTIFPDDSLWEDSSVFINTSYPIIPPTLGVATFDALDFSGSLYSNASSSSFLADMLTSRPINLEYAPEDSIYLSFYYQAQGIGDAPENTDYLELEFSSPDTSWHTVWKATGSSTHPFINVMIPISDSIYLKKGFQFRFLNYASLTGNFEPSWAGSVDHWNIDYVYLNKSRTVFDIMTEEVVVLNSTNSLINSYEAIPWKHFDNLSNSELKNTLAFSIFNYRNILKNVSFHYLITDVYKNELLYSDIYAEDILANSGYTYEIPPSLFDFSFPTSNEDSALFEVTYHITSDDQNYFNRWNDTLRYYQTFSDYYAYDDGTAENGYGLSGEGTQNAMLAYKFHTLSEDKLKAVDIFFNQTLGDASQKYFYLTVWSDKDNMPDTITVKQIGARPLYEEGLNRFHRYELDTPMIVSGTIYIGWIQTTADLLNVGFDQNRILNSEEEENWTNPKIFYNITGSWKNSSFEGALMMRPVFGDTLKKNIQFPIISTNSNINIFPNPANEIININYLDEVIQEDINIKIYNSIGNLVFNGCIQSGQINVGDFNSGIYFLRINNSKQSENNKRFIILK